MVSEFPKLQGHVGCLLAGFDGEDAGVAMAIEAMSRDALFLITKLDKVRHARRLNSA